MVGRVHAQNEIDQALNQSGEVAYQRFCTPCHGAAGAPGTAVSTTDKKPIDLRNYVAANGGTFPPSAWLAAITDPNPKLTHARVWERIRRAQSGANPNSSARGVVAQIARYIMSVQAKPE
jgi:mono/diheme cytochrome c family protein